MPAEGASAAIRDTGIGSASVGLSARLCPHVWIGAIRLSVLHIEHDIRSESCSLIPYSFVVGAQRDDKVQRFTTLGIDRAVLPCRKYGTPGRAQTRYFALKLPIALDAKAATCVYVDPGLTTDSELRSWSVAHAPLWAALRARTFAVQIVAIGTGTESASRANKVLRSWTRDGDGQGEPPPAWPTKADPEIQQEVAQLEHGIDHGDRTIIRAAGGFQAASKRLTFLYQLPDGTHHNTEPPRRD